MVACRPHLGYASFAGTGYRWERPPFTSTFDRGAIIETARLVTPHRLPAATRALRGRARLLAAALRPPARPLAADLAVPMLPVRSRSSRLVPDPVFVLSPIRSGSTLLRVLLNSHSEIRAPHEMHLRTLQVTMSREFTADVMADLGLDRDELEHLLWDRILHLELQRTGKSVIVDKTPANVLVWPRLARAWPQARYLFLIRDPSTIVESVTARRGGGDRDSAVTEVCAYADRLDAARARLPGLLIRYEDLTSDPATTMASVCAELGVGWEPAMLDYGRVDHGRFRPFAGDWSENIRSGRIQPARPAPDPRSVDERVKAVARRWGYPAD